MNDLYQWAIRHAVPAVALADLQRVLGVHGDAGQPTDALAGLSEAAVQNNVRLEAARKGMRLWRNNSGGDPNSGLRWGLANDSAAVNKVLKSSDLIGIDPTPITPDMVGQPRGQFLAPEMKPGGWVYTGTPEEMAQFAWIKLIISMGGRAMFCNRVGML